MTPERYRRAGEIYHAALALPPDDRSELLERACAGDADLLGDVESLLAAHARAGDFTSGSATEMTSSRPEVVTPLHRWTSASPTAARPEFRASDQSRLQRVWALTCPRSTGWPS